MNFFDLSDGTTAKSEKQFAMSNSMAPIPKGTSVEAICEQAKWDTSDFATGKFISLRWSVLKPSEYENRKVFQKIKICDPKASDKAKRMLAAIDANAGGKLVEAGREPTDEDLESALVNRFMVLKLEVYTIYEKEYDEATGKMVDTDEIASEGNWVVAVAPKGGPVKKPTPPASNNDIAI